MIAKSILSSSFLSTIATVKNINRGPQAIHSPHNAAGVATLIYNKYKSSSNSLEVGNIQDCAYPRESIHIPLRSKLVCIIVVMRLMDAMLKAIKYGTRSFPDLMRIILPNRTIQVKQNPLKVDTLAKVKKYPKSAELFEHNEC